MLACLAGLAGRRPKAAAAALAELVHCRGLERASEKPVTSVARTGAVSPFSARKGYSRCRTHRRDGRVALRCALVLPIPLVQPGSLDRGRDHLSEIRQNCLIDAAEVTVALVREFERSNGAAVKSREQGSE